MSIKIFYSWQSETDSRINKDFIEEALQQSVEALRHSSLYENVEFEVQIGTHGLPGSPSVAGKILDARIPLCDVFVADLSVVNKLNWLQKKVVGKNYRPHSNNNVMYECGIARNSVGVDRIIGVLNKVYGSPHEDPANVPFDIRDLRFPIEYSLHKIKSSATVMNKLVPVLTESLEKTITFALLKKKNQYNPLVTWGDWLQSLSIKEQYIKNEKISQVIGDILKEVESTNRPIRILGLSGLGKTRLLLEAFRPSNIQGSILLANTVLYVDLNVIPYENCLSAFVELNRSCDKKIVIIDNCSAEIHNKLMELFNGNENVRLITVYSNPEEISTNKLNNTNYISLRKEELTDIVSEIIDRDFNELNVDLKQTIKEFSQGIPMMAVLIAQSIRDGQEYVGRLDEKQILNKLLGTFGQNERNREILKSCALFNRFGYEDECRREIEFIAANKNITSVDGNEVVLLQDFDKVCTHFKNREIFEKVGRYLSMRPIPLAMYLAEEWLEPCSPERLLSVITSIANEKEPLRSSLSNALAEQMRYLGYSDKAKDLIAKITGPESPFDNAEVLNTELGSRFFRSFVEVNPEAIVNNLTRQFLNKPANELLQIVAGRRNLVWVLEALCFDKTTFGKGVRLLFGFASAENESWGNNATGQLNQLFHILLPGTEADLIERFAAIKWALEKDDHSYMTLSLSAMDAGLKHSHFVRFGGADKQGTRHLKDFQPSKKEVEIYWSNILQTLHEIYCSRSDFSDQAKDIIIKNTRGIIDFGFAGLVIPVINSISESRNNDWEEARNTLKAILNYEEGNLSPDTRREITEIIGKLTKDDFVSRFRHVNDVRYGKKPFSEQDSAVKMKFEELASEFAENQTIWVDSIFVLYESHLNFSYYFGENLYKIISNDFEKVNNFLSLSLSKLQEIDSQKRDVTVLLGFIAGADYEAKMLLYSALANNSDLRRYLSLFIANDTDGEDYINLLFKLVEQNEISAFEILKLEYGSFLNSKDGNYLAKFFRQLYEFGEQGQLVALKLSSSFIVHKKETRDELIPVSIECLNSIEITKIYDQLNGYDWSELIRTILLEHDDADFAIRINEWIINTISFKNYLAIDSYLQRVYDILVKKYFFDIWPKLSDALLSIANEYYRFWCLKYVLGSQIGGVSRQIGILFAGDIDAIFKWCTQNTPLAAARLAELVPIYGGNNNNYRVWHPIALRLLNEFGNYPEVLQGLSINMGSYSWTGSSVPLLQSQRDLFSSIANHRIQEVRNWADSKLNYLEKHIQSEIYRDEEGRF